MSYELRDTKLIESTEIEREVDIERFDADTAELEAEIVRLQGIVASRKAERDKMLLVAPELFSEIEDK